MGGSTKLSMLSRITTEFVGYGFVDNVDLVITEDRELLFQKAQEGLDTWEGGLHATGGALQITDEKTFYYVISFKWKNNKWEYTNIKDIPGELFSPNDQGIIKKLQREEVTKANETLGTILAPNGDMEQQIKKLKAKADQFSAFILTGQISRKDASHALKSTIWKPLEYPMALTSLSRKQWDKVIKNMIQNSLPKTGVIQNFPRNLTFADSEYQGLSYQHPFIIQITTQISTINKFWNNGSTTGGLIRNLWENTIQQTGMRGEPSKWNWKN